MSPEDTTTAPTLDQYTGIRHVAAKLRAGAFHDGAKHLRDTDLPDNYVDTFGAGVDWAVERLTALTAIEDRKAEQ